MIETVASVIESLANLAKSIASSNDAAKRNSQLIEFQNALIQLNARLASTQAECATLTQENEALKREAMRLKDFAAEKERYALKQVEPGITVQALKESMCNGEPPHYVCANCFTNGKKHLLQSYVAPDRKWGLECSNCKTKMHGREFGPAIAAYS